MPGSAFTGARRGSLHRLGLLGTFIEPERMGSPHKTVDFGRCMDGHRMRSKALPGGDVSGHFTHKRQLRFGHLREKRDHDVFQRDNTNA